MAEDADQSWHINVNVQGKTFNISVGEGVQRLKWLAHVGIARWDENDNQGWKRLGVPTVIRHKYKDGPELDMGAIINTVLQDGDQIFVSTSLTPSETSY